MSMLQRAALSPNCAKYNSNAPPLLRNDPLPHNGGAQLLQVSIGQRAAEVSVSLRLAA